MHDNCITSNFLESLCGTGKNLNGFHARDKKFKVIWWTFLQMQEKSFTHVSFYQWRRTYNCLKTCDDTMVCYTTPFMRHVSHMGFLRTTENGASPLTKPSISRLGLSCVPFSLSSCVIVSLLTLSRCGNNTSHTSVMTCHSFSPSWVFAMWCKMPLKIMVFISSNRLSFGVRTGLWKMLAWLLPHVTGTRFFVILCFRIICSLILLMNAVCSWKMNCYWTKNSMMDLITLCNLYCRTKSTVFRGQGCRCGKDFPIQHFVSCCALSYTRCTLHRLFWYRCATASRR